ncbi:MAG: hypothetical protein ACYC64_12845, partial [Armatimonadota bacterium]
MSRVVTLVFYDLKRFARHRPIWMTLYALPLVMALLRVIFSKSQVIQTAAWVCPIVCALMVWAIMLLRTSVDRGLGLEAGLRSTPMSDSSILWAHIAAGAVLVAGQMVIFTVILMGAHVKSTESGCNLGSLYDIIDSLVQDSSSQVCNGLYSRFFPA